MRKSFIKRQHF